MATAVMKAIVTSIDGTVRCVPRVGGGTDLSVASLVGLSREQPLLLTEVAEEDAEATQEEVGEHAVKTLTLTLGTPFPSSRTQVDASTIASFTISTMDSYLNRLCNQNGTTKFTFLADNDYEITIPYRMTSSSNMTAAASGPAAGYAYLGICMYDQTPGLAQNFLANPIGDNPTWFNTTGGFDIYGTITQIVTVNQSGSVVASSLLCFGGGTAIGNSSPIPPVQPQNTPNFLGNLNNVTWYVGTAAGTNQPITCTEIGYIP